MGKRFWSRVAAPHPDTCWLWLGAHDEKGYGRVGRARTRAHRIAYELAHGEFDQSLVVLHDCDNPGCVNPGHLRLGTQLDNIADREQKGRGAVPPSRRALSSDDVAASRSSSSLIAFGVSRGNVSKIVNAVSYPEVAR